MSERKGTQRAVSRERRVHGAADETPPRPAGTAGTRGANPRGRGRRGHGRRSRRAPPRGADGPPAQWETAWRALPELEHSRHATRPPRSSPLTQRRTRVHADAARGGGWRSSPQLPGRGSSRARAAEQHPVGRRVHRRPGGRGGGAGSAHTARERCRAAKAASRIFSIM